jgi:anti-sigma regulatory factor (Ser/Thr protein kinase)
MRERPFVTIRQRRQFEGSRLAVGEARAFLREVLHGRAPPDVEDDLVLALSELAANAVLHAGTPFEVAVETGDQVHIEVHDGSTRMPRRAAPVAPEAVAGRGLLIVEQLCDRWGVSLADDRKCVWCERDLVVLPRAQPVTACSWQVDDGNH